MASGLPFFSAHKPERPKLRNFKLNDEVYLKAPVESFPELTTTLKGVVVSPVVAESVQPLYKHRTGGFHTIRKVVFPATLQPTSGKPQIFKETIEGVATKGADGKEKVLMQDENFPTRNPSILVEFDFGETGKRQFYIPAKKLELMEWRKWKEEHDEDPLDPDPAPRPPKGPSGPEAGAAALPLPAEDEKPLVTDAVATQKVGS